MRRAALGLAMLVAPPAWAQMARNPFAVGINEGAVGEVGRIGQWLLAQQAQFDHALRQAASTPGATATVLGLAFAYGLFHAAGPGHGKAVIASYMLANEQALRRGLVLSALAALWQALVAIALVGVAAALLGLTAAGLIKAAQAVEVASYAGVAALGLWLAAQKARALYRLLKPATTARFVCDDGTQGADCPHCVAPDPQKLDAGFSWRQAAATVAAAGSRPCSGALLLLVFTLARGRFGLGVAAVFAMAAGTALATGALASAAVLAKGFGARLLGAKSRRGEIFARALEFLAALAVLLLGSVLLFGAVAAP